MGQQGLSLRTFWLFSPSKSCWVSLWTHVKGSFRPISCFWQQAVILPQIVLLTLSLLWPWDLLGWKSFLFSISLNGFFYHQSIPFRDNVNFCCLQYSQGRSFTAQLCIVCKGKLFSLACVIRHICCPWFLYWKVEWTFYCSPSPCHTWSHTILLPVTSLAWRGYLIYLIIHHRESSERIPSEFLIVHTNFLPFKFYLPFFMERPKSHTVSHKVTHHGFTP